MKKNITYQMSFWNENELKWHNVDTIAKNNGLTKAELFKRKKYYLYLYHNNNKVMITLDDINYDIILREIDIFEKGGY